MQTLLIVKVMMMMMMIHYFLQMMLPIRHLKRMLHFLVNWQSTKHPEDEKYLELKKVVTEEQEDDACTDQGILKTGVKPTPLSLLHTTDQQEADYCKALADGDVEDEERRHTESFPVWDPRGWHEDNPEDMPPSYCTFCRCPLNKCHNQLFGQFCQL
jgi:hypothetical protein